MPPYNATDSIFFGFRLFRRDPLMMLTLIAVLAIATLIEIQLTWRQTLAFASEYLAFSQAVETQTDDAAAAAAFGELMKAMVAYLGDPVVLLCFFVLILVRLAIQGSILRGLVLDRREGWVMGIQLGGDELRIFVVSLVTMLILLGLGMAASFGVGLVAGVLGLANPTVGGLIATLGLLACAIGLLLVWTRLSAAPAASVGERRFIVLGSWHFTKGRMWSLLGAYVILVFLVIVAQLAVYVASAVIAKDAAALMQGFTAIEALDDPGAAFRSPGYVLLTLFNAALEVGAVAAFAGVGAYAYRWLGGKAGYPNAQPPADAPLTAVA
jgi:hypothetical protein